MQLRRLTMMGMAALIAACGKNPKVESGGEIDLSADAELLGTSRGPIGMTDRQVLTWLTESHRGEVELAEFMRERAADEEIKSLAGDLRVDHGRLVREGGMLSKQLAKPGPEDSLSAPSLDSLAARQARTMAQLRALTADSLDRALAKTLVAMHERMLDTLTKWKGKALDPKLNAAMDKAEPIIEGHLTEARRIEERLKKVAKARADSVKKVAKLKADSLKAVQTERARRDSAKKADARSSG